MHSKSPTGNEPENRDRMSWIDEPSAGEPGDTLANRPGSMQRAPRVAVFVFGVFCVAIMALGVFTLASHEPVAAPLPPPTPVPTPTLDFDAVADPIVQKRFDATMARLPPLAMVLPRLDGNPALRVTTTAGVDVDPGVLQGLHSFALDQSGQWLAALAGRPEGAGADLWLGPVAGELEPIQSGVLGFAWHNRDAGRLAYSHADLEAVFSLVADSPADLTRLFSTTHHLEHWGDWGFVLRPELNDLGFHVLDPDGTEVATGYRGTVIGALNQRLVVNLAGGQRSPIFVFADTGQAWPVFALTDTQLARSLTEGSDNTVAIQVSDFENDVHEIRVFPGSGAPVRAIETTESTGALSWSLDGSRLYFLSQTSSKATELWEYHVATDSLRSTLISDTAAINHWSSSLSVQPQ